MKTFTSLVRVCERGVLRYKKKAQLDTEEEKEVKEKASQESKGDIQREGSERVQQGGNVTGIIKKFCHNKKSLGWFEGGGGNPLCGCIMLILYL